MRLRYQRIFGNIMSRTYRKPYITHSIKSIYYKNSVRRSSYTLKYFTRKNYRTKIKEQIINIKKDINNFDNIVFNNYKRFSNPWDWF